MEKTPTPKQTSNGEVRNYTSKLEIRNDESGTLKTIDGYAVKYNQESETMLDWYGDKFVEVFAEGAFDESIKTRNQKGLWNHDTSKPLGSVKSNTMTLLSDNVGLRYTLSPPNNTWGKDAVESITRGDVDGSSFAFRVLEGGEMWSLIEKDGVDIYKRTIMKAEISEVSPCTFPAYPDSTTSTREFKCRNKVLNKNNLRRKKILLKTYL